MNWTLDLHIFSDPKLCIHYSQVFDEQFMKKTQNPNINYACCRMIDSPPVTKLLFFRDWIANLKKKKGSLIIEVLNPVMHKCICSDNSKYLS